MPILQHIFSCTLPSMLRLILTHNLVCSFSQLFKLCCQDAEKESYFDTDNVEDLGFNYQEIGVLKKHMAKVEEMKERTHMLLVASPTKKEHSVHLQKC